MGSERSAAGRRGAHRAGARTGGHRQGTDCRARERLGSPGAGRGGREEGLGSSPKVLGGGGSRVDRSG